MTAKARILVVDDEQSMREFLEIFFRGDGYDVTTTGDVDSALARARRRRLRRRDQRPPDAGPERPRAAPRGARTRPPETVVIMITAFATAETAIAAMKQGAYDYLTKPFKVDEIRLVVEKALEKRLLAARERSACGASSARRPAARHLVGSSRAMQQLYEHGGARRADTRTNVLIQGESGTGKELVARAIHDQSERARAAVRRRQLRRDPREPARARALRPREGRLHRRRAEQARASSSRPTAARSSSTRSASSRRRSQVKLLRVLQDKAAAARSAARRSRPGRRPHHRRDQPRPRGRRWPRGASARTSTTG